MSLDPQTTDISFDISNLAGDLCWSVESHKDFDQLGYEDLSHAMIPAQSAN